MQKLEAGSQLVRPGKHETIGNKLTTDASVSVL